MGEFSMSRRFLIPDRWALTNPHVSLHIPTESRLKMVPSKKKKNGRPRRPLHSLKSVVSNLHLLTSVPSFARWPLNVHFFAEEAYKAWGRWLKSNDTPSRDGLEILTEFGPPGGQLDSPWGIHALPVDYTPLKSYVEKSHNVVAFEREGKCVHCKEDLESEQGLHPMCSTDGCEAMGHLDCWSKHALVGADEGTVLPDRCTCPSCGGEVRWGDMMKELSLRIRGPKEVEKLLKKKRRSKKAVVTVEA